MKKILCLLTISAFCASAAAFPRPETGYAFTNISMENDLLPGSNVVAILNDGSQIWFGTRSGLTALSENGKKSWNIAVASHESICKDSSGDIWVTSDNGIFMYDRLGGDLLKVRDDKGLCCCSIGDEVCVYGHNHLYFYPTGRGNDPRIIELDPALSIISMAVMPDGTLVMGNCEGGLYGYDISGGEFYLFNKDSHPNIRRIRIVGDVIYVLSYGGGVCRYTTDGTSLGRIEGIGSDYVTDLAVYDGRLWISTDGEGLYIYDPDSGELSQIKHIQGDAGSFPANALTTLLTDGDAGLWVGTVRYGAFNISKKYIHTFADAQRGNSRGLSERCVVGLYEDPDGTCWIGTDGEGINRFDPGSLSFRHYPTTFKTCVPRICRYDDTHLLAVIFNKGMFLFDTASGAISPFKIFSKEENIILFDNGEFPSIFSPRSDKIFMLGRNSYIHDPASGTLEKLVRENGRTFSSTMPGSWYNDDFILVYANDEILINRYDDSILHPLCSVSRGSVTALSYDPIHSCIWTVTDRSEIGSFSFEGGTVSRYERLSGIELENVSTLTSDSKGKLWITTGNALFVYDKDSGKVKKFSNYDGYERNDIATAFSSLSNSGRLYVAGSAGLVMVNTDIADAPGIAEPPVISLSSIVTADRRLEAGSLDLSETVQVPWNKGFLNLEYSVSGLHFQEKAVIKYTISGKTGSSLVTSSHTLDLSNLAPGQYTVTAACIWGGETLTEGQSLSLNILPPWYNSTLFYTVMVLLAVFIVVFLSLRYANANASEKNRVSERDKDFLRRFCEYVALNLDKDLSSDVLTRELGVSRTSLFEKVKALTGYSLNDYVKKMRVEKAMSLLENSEMNINEISDALGFSYPRYFSSVFKEMTGESPTAYRKKRHHLNS